MLPSTLQFFIAMIASAINDRMQRKLRFREVELQVLKEKVQALSGSERLHFTAEERRRLAKAGKELTAAERRECCRLVKPETLMAWYRRSSRG